jgi:hypothetical protein
MTRPAGSSAYTWAMSNELSAKHNAAIIRLYCGPCVARTTVGPVAPTEQRVSAPSVLVPNNPDTRNALAGGRKQVWQVTE